MNRARIYQAIEDPAFLSDIPLDELERLRDAYPWFSTAHALLAKAYQIKDDHRFTDQLRHAAIYSGNRRLLYDFIRKEINPSPAENAAEVDSTETPQELAPIEILTPTTPSKTAEQTPPVQEPESEAFFDLFSEPSTPRENEGDSTLLKLEGTVPEATHSFDDLVEAILVDEESVVSQSPRAPDEGEKVELHSSFHLADPFVPELIADALLVEEEPLAAEASEEGRREASFTVDVRSMDALEKAILAEAISSSIKRELGQPDATDDKEWREEKRLDSDLKNTEFGVESTTEDPYTLWLQRRSSEIHYGETPKVDIIRQEPSAELKPSEEKISSRSEMPRIAMEVPGKQAHQTDLIERFMRLDPKITPGKSNEYDTSNIARESLEEDFNLVTETMARLYAQQGKLDKARKVYRRLIELHPEKSVYFAAQLKNLNTFKKG